MDDPAVTFSTVLPAMRRLVGGKWLRCGYTTGTCAAAAAKAAVSVVMTGQLADTVQIVTPVGTRLTLDVLDTVIGKGQASCAVRKDGGDDPDATDGALIYACVERTEGTAIVIDGGEGIGRVTQPGLDQPVGEPAINTVPRRMIDQAVRDATEGEVGGWRVVISCPTGEKIAAKTFNPKLGIVGGISILGTTGIVEPMSNAALIETMAREISILAAVGIKDLLVVIGNYGETYARDVLGLPINIGISHACGSPQAFGQVKSSNFIGDAIAQAADHSFERVMIVGHLGKLVKVGIGMLNTHSSMGDGRIETLVACALETGADRDVLRELLGCVSTDAAVAVLTQAGILPATMDVLGRRIQATFDRHTPADLRLEWMCFTRLDNAFRLVAHSGGAWDLIRKWYPS